MSKIDLDAANARAHPPRGHLAAALGAAREHSGLLHKQLAQRAGIGASKLSSIMTGGVLPDLGTLAALAGALDVDPVKATLLRALDAVQNAGMDAEVQASVANWLWEAAERLPGSRPKTQGRTLLDFPHAFPDLVVVTGDKREVNPRSAGDLGAVSASPIDDRWIFGLGLPKDTQKVSDKEFAACPQEALSERYGHKNLLVIGSPASNHLARIINGEALFPFNLRDAYRQHLEEFMRRARAIPQLERLAEEQRQFMPALKSWMQAFFTGGILDPVKGDVQGFALHHDKDYATITFARNPYAARGAAIRVCILVAGYHHPGTALALRCLGDRQFLDGRPYGGVLEITLDLAQPWERRVQEAQAHWETKPYSLETLMRGLDGLRDGKDESVAAGAPWAEAAKSLVSSL